MQLIIVFVFLYALFSLCLKSKKKWKEIVVKVISFFGIIWIIICKFFRKEEITIIFSK